MTASNVPPIAGGDQPYPAPATRGGFTQVVGSRWAELCDRHRLSLGAQALLLRLLLAADRRTESVGYYTQDAWADVLGVHRNSVRKLQRELEAAGCIVVAKVPRACHYSVLLTCWAEVVQPAKGSSGTHIASTGGTHPVQGVHNPSAQVQGFRSPIERERDRAPGDQQVSERERIVLELLELFPRVNRREAERWVTDVLAAHSTDQVRRALADARAAGSVRYPSWVTKRLEQRYSAEPAAHPADRPTGPVYCTPCFEQHGEPLQVGACRCERRVTLTVVAS